MTKGLITRIGEWIDRKWANKATEAQLEELGRRFNESLASAQVDLAKAIQLKSEEAEAELTMQGKALADTIRRMAQHHDMIGTLEIKVLAMKQVDGELLNKEIADIKTRFEKLELYLGMSRKVDPTKPAVAKSAFAM